MPEINVIDTYPAFLSYWNHVQHLPVGAQITRWKSEYMASWPKLMNKQIDDCEADAEDWQAIAREQVFSDLDRRIQNIQVAHDGLLKISSSLLARTKNMLEFEGELIIVIYVGIGLGAGWSTTFEGRPAILLGLENIAECGWISREALSGLIVNEFGHLSIFTTEKKPIRNEALVPGGSSIPKAMP